jgi:oligosaccharide:H+ symporter
MHRFVFAGIRMKKRQLSSKQNLWLIRLYYFILFIGMGALNPFINLYYSYRHLSGTEIGLLSTVGSVVALSIAPFWGRLTDTISKPRRIMQLTFIGSATLLFIMSMQTVFLAIALCVGLEALMSGGSDSLRNSQAVSVAEEAQVGFGSIRLWGSLGWAIAAPISGWVIQQTSIRSIFYIYAIAALMAVAVLGLITTQAKRRPLTEEAPVAARPALREVAKGVWKNPELMGFFVALVVMWAATNGTKFEALFITQLGAPTTIIGWANTVAAGTEVLVMLQVDRFIRRFDSTKALILAFSLNACSLIYLLISPSITAIFVMKVIAALGNSFYMLSFVAYIVERAPSGQSTTVLALFGTTANALVTIIVSPFMGYLFDLIGPYWLYVIAFCGFASGALIMYFTVERKRRSEGSGGSAPEELVNP